ncbi:uncharacterized protein NECHADRAFT_88686 [Fusarium vanettenii 77-13-4]|uniref:Uncharacterized protein n=1 Tax=Fusarium vanettenii (strain ATCC MYA-4622 / CBS 123669 / FGSC 9596 / NRRL 45880 / 77-13-4) TaxID=660122 RepID=C7ZLI4_FUSV7|nr:uncharacterized protein NECHADRAFT_88686 [Fusarium vanettenii 77-13-4]EEU35141.1 predicted protein [Fusarium vanettenii 77-13-4]
MPDEKVDPYMRGRQLRRIYEKYKDQNGGKTVKSINATDLALMEYCPLSESTKDEKRFVTEWATNARSLGGALGAWRKSMRELGYVARPMEDDAVPASKAKQDQDKDKGKSKDVESLEPVQEQNEPNSAVPDSPRVSANMSLVRPPPAVNPPVTEDVVAEKLDHSQVQLSPDRRPDPPALTESRLQVSHANAAIYLPSAPTPESRTMTITPQQRPSSSAQPPASVLRDLAQLSLKPEVEATVGDTDSSPPNVIPRRNVGSSHPVEAGEMVYPDQVSRASSTAHGLSQREEDVDPALTTEDGAIFTVEDGDLYRFYHALRHGIVPRPGPTS